MIWTSGVRLAAGSTVFCSVAPALAAGLVGLGIPAWLAIAGGVTLAAGAAFWASSHLAAPLREAVSSIPVWPLIVLMGIYFLVPMARLSVYMADVTRTDCAFMPQERFRLLHSCFSAYSEAGRFSTDANRNIYLESSYVNRTIGPLRVDPYHYPPPFLLLPRAIQAISGGFFNERPLWFAMQVVLFVGTAVGLCWWIGGAMGGRALLILPIVMSSQSMLAGLQQGNFQITAVSLTVLGLMLAASSRVASGGAILAFTTVGKIFPGLLLVYLLFARRWKTLIAVGVWGIAFVAVTLVLMGTKPFVDFVQYEVPRISDGSAFPQTEWPRTVAVNTGFYGATVKMRVLGVTALDPTAGKRLTDVYGVLLIALAVALGWKQKGTAPGVSPDARLDAAVIWLALVGLASFRSPFVGMAYGMASTMWLVSLLAARRTTTVSWVATVGWFAFAYLATLAIPSPNMNDLPPPDWAIWLALIMQIAMFAINAAVLVWVVAPRRADDRALDVTARADVQSQALSPVRNM